MSLRGVGGQNLPTYLSTWKRMAVGADRGQRRVDRAHAPVATAVLGADDDVEKKVS